MSWLLVYILSSEKLSTTGQRWVNELADFNLKIHYIPSRNHQDADALSRFPENIHQYTSRAEQSSINAIFEGVQTQSENEEAWLCAINTTETTPEIDTSPPHKNNLQQVDIYHEQNQDHCIKKVKDIIQSRVQLSLSQNQREPQLLKRLLREKEKLLVNNKGVLIRRTPKVDQIVIPPSLRNLVYQELHEKMGNLGGKRVYQLAKERFYWPGMEKDIEDYIKNKCICLSQRKPHVLPQVSLGTVKSSGPMDIVGIDFLKVDKCSGGYEYILVITDHFARYTQIYVTKKKSARTAASKLYSNFILNFGSPERILHD